MKNKPFIEPFVVIRSKFNPLRYILGKEKIVWGEKLSGKAIREIDIDVSDIKFTAKDSEEVMGKIVQKHFKDFLKEHPITFKSEE